MSIERILTPQRLRRFSTYDLEWIPGSLEVRLVGVFDGNEYTSYTSVRAFLQHELTFSSRGRWFYAHAGGLADLQFVLNEIDKINKESPGFYKVNASFSGSSAIIAKISRSKHTWIFVDSYWLLRDKLKNIAKWIGYEKGNTGDEKDDPDEHGISDKEYDRRMSVKREWFASVDIYTLREYNEKDCVILWKAIDEFEDTLLSMGGQLQMTIASSALQLFKRKYLTRNIATFAEVNDRARRAYFASRVEVFETKIEKAWYYDVNSSFPHAMTSPCPGVFLGRSSRIPDNPDNIFIADCEIEVRNSHLPPMPKRMGGRVFFPSGKWRSWVSSVDLFLLQSEGGRILKVHEVLHFSPFTDLASYATDLYSKRVLCTSPFEKVAYKLLLNSLYGKFAESSTKTGLLMNPDKVPLTKEDEIDMGMVQLFPGSWLFEKQVDVPHMSVPISMHITSIARKTLFDYISNCRDYHYCDTDGFSTTEAISTSTELGGLKLEKEIDSGHFVSSKMYNINGKELQPDGSWREVSHYKGKGFSRLTATRFSQLMEGEAIEFERMSRIRESWRGGDSVPKEKLYRKRINIKPLFDKDYDVRKHVVPKRFTYPDGQTRPWHYDELSEMFGEDEDE